MRLHLRWLVLVPALAACTPAPSPPAAPGEAPGVTLQAFQQLRWVEGRWRGEAPGGAPFYERYRFENDSTVHSYTYADAAGTAPTDSGAITLRAGQVTMETGGARWAATELASSRIRFAPLAGARNSFVWERTSPDAWTATLSWPATADRPARTVVYPMRRSGP